MKNLIQLLLIMGSLVILSGCGKKEMMPEPEKTPAEMTPTVTEAPARKVVPVKTDYLTEEDMQKASPWKSCDNSSLAAAMKKAEDGEPVTIAVIGGSITQGVISKGTLDAKIESKSCYADIFFAWWKESFPDSLVTVINAGIGGTDSYLGVHRVQKDVLDHHPDVVLIEYSVNDGANNFYKNSYDNLVRKVLKSEDSPAVLLLFMAQTSLTSAQSVHQLIGFNYELPMVSHLNLISHFYETGRYTEEELSGDVSHPSVLGHALVGEMLWKYLNAIYEELDAYGEPKTFDKRAVTKERYQNAELAGVQDITPVSMTGFETYGRDFNGWGDVWHTQDGNGRIIFKVKCRNLGILFWRTTNAVYGSYDVYVDGVHKATLQAEYKDGWGNYAYSQEIFVSEEDTEHTIMIEKSKNSTGDCFTLLRLMLSH